MEEGKVCPKCGEWKPFEGFSKNKNLKDGLQSQCKECHKRHSKQWRQRNDEKMKQYRQENVERMKQYRQENVEQIKEKMKQYRQENVEQIKEWEKKYRQENIEQIRQQRKQHYKENAERLKESTKKWREENPEQAKKYYKQYCQENAEWVRKYRKQYQQSEKGKELFYRANLKRRSYKHKVIFQPHERQQILERDKWECQSCKIKVHDRSSGDWNTPDKAHIDHIIPISKGGNSEPNNLQILCRSCNLSKHDKVM